MPTAAEHLERVAPYLFDPDDPRFADADLVGWALAVAEPWRPSCLPAERQNLAQAWRAAFEILSLPRVDASSASGATQTVGVAGAVVERQEGDVRVRFSDGKTTTGITASGTNAGPGTAYSRWLELWSLCGGVAPDGSGGTETAVRRGALITRAGFG